MRRFLLYFILIFVSIFFLDKVHAYDKYVVGDEVTFRGEKYYVIKDSSSDSNYVTLLKATPLTYDEINRYGRDENEELFVNKYLGYFYQGSYISRIIYKYRNNIGGIAFYTNNNCTCLEKRNFSGCTNSYEISDVKKVIDNWKEEFDDDLVLVDGYKARLLFSDELVSNFGFQVSGEDKYSIVSKQKFRWLYDVEAPFWIMNTIASNYAFRLSGTKLRSGEFSLAYVCSSTASVRPVINVKKSSINLNTKQYKYKSYNVGDKYIYKNTEFYVMEESDVDSDHLFLLRADLLTKEQINKYSNNSYVSENGEVPYYYSDNCNLDNETGCVNDYNKSLIKTIIDNYVKNELDENDLMEVDGYKAKILDVSTLKQNDFFNIGYDSLTGGKILDDTPEFIKKFSNLHYWLMPWSDKLSNSNILTNEFLDYEKVYNKAYVRPIIYLKKKPLNTIVNQSDAKLYCKNGYKKVTHNLYKKYVVGDEVELKGEKYYVVEDSYNQNYVVLLKDNLLTREEIDNYSSNPYLIYKNIFGRIPYFESETCNSSFINIDEMNCNRDYNQSYIKQIVDKWVLIYLNEDDLVSVDGYKARLLYDTLEIKAYGGDDFSNFLRNTDYYYYIMDGRLLGKREISSDYGSIYNYYAVRPVINLKKSVLGDRVSYQRGEKVVYKNKVTNENEDYYVVSNDDDNNYVTLVKDIPLTSYQIESMNTEREYGVAPFDISDDCISFQNGDFYAYSFRSTTGTGCINNYNNSIVKSIIDNWAMDRFNDNELIDIDGYKARLINTFELFNNLFYNYRIGVTDYSRSYIRSPMVPKWFYENKEFWTMSGYEDYNNYIYYVNKNGNAYFTDHLYIFKGVRPVINYNKCLLDGGCYEEDEYICLDAGVGESEYEDESKSVVSVENTLSYVSKILLVISVLLIICGSVIIGHNYIKSRKDRL